MFEECELEIEATYVTAGGKRLEVFSETYRDDDTTIYGGQCPGCNTGLSSLLSYAERCNRALVLRTAQKHARACTAI